MWNGGGKEGLCVFSGFKGSTLTFAYSPQVSVVALTVQVHSSFLLTYNYHYHSFYRALVIEAVQTDSSGTFSHLDQFGLPRFTAGRILTISVSYSCYDSRLSFLILIRPSKTPLRASSYFLPSTGRLIWPLLAS